MKAKPTTHKLKGTSRDLEILAVDMHEAWGFYLNMPLSIGVSYESAEHNILPWHRHFNPIEVDIDTYGVDE